MFSRLCNFSSHSRARELHRRRPRAVWASWRWWWKSLFALLGIWWLWSVTLDHAWSALLSAVSFEILTASLYFASSVFRKAEASKGHFKMGQREHSRTFVHSNIHHVSYMCRKEWWCYKWFFFKLCGVFSNTSNISRLVHGFEEAPSGPVCGEGLGGGSIGRKAHQHPAVVVVLESRRVLLALTVCSLNLQSSHVFPPRKSVPALWIHCLQAL